MKNKMIILSLFILFYSISTSSADENSESENKIELEKMVVTGEALSEQSVMDAPANVTVITREDIEVNPARTVDDLLKTSAGVDLYKPWGLFGPSSHIRLRGFSNPRSTVFLRDGMPINRMICGGAIHNEIPVDLVERLEMVRGANASLYGAGAMGGVINIITKKPEKGFHASVDASFGSHNTWTSSFVLNGAVTDKISMQINYDHFDTEGYFSWADSWIKDRTEKMTLQNLESWKPVKENYLASLENQKRKMDNIFAKLRISLSPSSEINLTLSEWKNDNNIGYRYGYINQERNRFAADYKRKGFFNIAANVFYLSENMKFSQPVLPAPWMTTGQGESTWLTQGEKNDIPIKDAGGMFSISRSVGEYHRLTLSTDHRFVSTENRQYDGQPLDIQSISQGKQYKWGLVIQDAVSAGNITASLSLRYDSVKTYDFYSEDLTSYTKYEDRDDHQLNPKIGLTWDINKATVLRASAGRVSTFPPLMYLIGNYETPPGRMMLGNPDLSTEYSHSYETGLEHFFSSGVMLKFTAFYNDIRNWMQEVSTNDPEYSAVSVRWENIEKAETSGVELEAEYYPSDNLKIFANYNYTNSEVKEFRDKGHNYKNSDLENNLFPTQPRNRFNAGITWFKPELATVSLTMRYVGKRFWDIENETELDEFVTFDIKVSRKLCRHITASLEVTDVLDKAWQETEMHVTPGRMILGRMKVSY